MKINSQKEYYRFDIQSLRGIAILAVVFYHLSPKIFPYGYLGVDLFFVISGYLITSIVLKKLIINEFSFKHFILKRLYRIYVPILFSILFFSTVSFFILLPKDLSDFWNSVLATLFFVPNLYFWLKGGYFGTLDEYKTLLHFWSLGLEVQFYFFFSIILIIFFKYVNRKNIFISVLILCVFSFFFNLAFYNTVFNFFNLPGRLWEFCVGSLAFLIPQSKKKNSLYFLFLLIIFIVLFSHFKALSLLKLPCIVLVSGFLIYYGNVIYDKNLIINNKIFQFFGKISYSLYLIHWPIIVFYKYYIIRGLYNYEVIILFLFIVISSYYFWLLIENYYNRKLLLNYPYKLVIIFYIILLLIYILNFFNNSSLKKISANNLLISQSINSHYRCQLQNYSFDIHFNKSCRLLINKEKKNSDEIALLGNSNAQMYGYAFENILRQLNINGSILALDGCLPTINLNISKRCIDLANVNLSKIIQDKNIKLVLIGLDWHHTFLIDKFNNRIDKNINIILAESIYYLAQELHANNKKVIVIGPLSIPEYYFSFDLSRKVYFNNKTLFLKSYNEKKDFEDKFKDILYYYSNKKFVYFIKPHEIQCPNTICNFLISGKSIFSDPSHLSKDGSLIMQNLLFEAVTKSLKL